MGDADLDFTGMLVKKKKKPASKEVSKRSKGPTGFAVAKKRGGRKGGNRM